MKLRALAVTTALCVCVAGARATDYILADHNVAGLINSINDSNFNNSDDTIHLFKDGVYTLTTINNTTVTGANGLPPIVGDNGHTLTIEANGARIERSSAVGIPSFRIFRVEQQAKLTLKNVTLSRGLVDVPGDNDTNKGGAMSIDFPSTVTLNNCKFFGNAATGASAGGGAIFARGDVTLTECYFDNNSATKDPNMMFGASIGGAIYSSFAQLVVENSTFGTNAADFGAAIASEDDRMTLVNSTFAANTARLVGGGLYLSGGQVSMTNCTVTGNNVTDNSVGRSGGISFNKGTFDEFSIRNTIVAGNTAHTGPDFGNAVSGNALVTSLGHNFIGKTDGSTGWIGSDLTGTIASPRNAMLNSLGSNGGNTPTASLQVTSEAIDHGDDVVLSSPVSLATDQRAAGYARKLGSHVDIGAFEYDAPIPGPNFTVTNVDEYSDGVCGANCSLRDAILQSNAQAGNHIINFASGVHGTIQLRNPLQTLSKNITINGPGADLLTIRRNNTNTDFRIFTISNGTVNGPVISLSGMTLTNGKAPSPSPVNGGGILNDRGTLTLTKCAVTNNTATNGGGINNGHNQGGSSTLTMVDCTISGNTGNFGGAISNTGFGGTDTVTLTNCTIADNTATGRGGAVYNVSSGGAANLNLTNCTVSNNNAGALGAICNEGSSGNAIVTLGNTILKAASGSVNLVNLNNAGSFVSHGHNISDDAAGGPSGTAPGGLLNGPGDMRNTDPLLGALFNFGGPTNTIDLSGASPAINNAVNAPARDQRNYVRSGAPDIGAFEFAGTLPNALGNISTRGFVQTGNNVMIGGLIVSGSLETQVVVRALGPTLGQAPFNVPGALANPTLELLDVDGALIASNDNWVDAPKKQAIINSGYAPPNNLEPAILTNLNPGSYTAIVRGVNNTSGVALVEAYDLDFTAGSQFGNISTRGFVGTGNNVMIAGVIVHGPDSKDVIIRGLGPTLAQFGVPTVLANPTLDLRNANGTSLKTNDNWKDTQQAQIQASGLAPPNDKESAIAATLAAGNYTAILSGKNNTTGNALVEVYGLN